MRPERLRELSLLAVLAVAVLIFSLLIDNYLGGSFFNRVTTSVAITAILAAGQTIVILTRNIDLSVGSIVGVTAYVTGEYLHDHPDLAPVLAVAYAVAIGGGLGLLNGALVAYARVPSIIVTLGTLAIFRTWLINHSDSRTITSDGLPDWVLDLPNSTLVSFGEWDLRTVVLGAVVLIVVLQLLLGGLKWGRWVYAVGSNPDAARQAALPVERVILGAFVASGALAGLAGFLFLSRFGTITVNAGNGLELAVRRGRGGRRREHLRRLGDADRRAARRAADQPARPQPAARAGAERVLARRRARRADPHRGRRRLPARQAHRPAHLAREEAEAGVPAARGARCLTRRSSGAGSCSSRSSSSPCSS